MGAKQSRRSVDITTTPKRSEIESPIEGEGKVEKISDLETKIATNGSIHNEIEYADKEETEKEEAEAAVKENGVSDSEGSKTPDADVSIGDQLNESSEVAEKSTDSLEKSDETNENNKKNKEKSKKKKWSFRSISFSRKDKSKPGKDEKNGDVKEVNEEGAEETVATPTSPEGGKPDDAGTPSLPVEAEPITNGEVASPDSAEPKVEEQPKLMETAEPKLEEPNVEEAKKEEPSTVKEEPKVEEPKLAVEVSEIKMDQCKMEEIKADENVVAESKEVRNEEIPPPLPSSNPPSPVTVFAESTMADAPSTDHVPITQSTSPAVESAAAPISAIAHPDDTPESLSAPFPIPDTENISSKGDCPESSPTLSASESISQPVSDQLLESQALPVAETQSLLEPIGQSPPTSIAESPPVSVPEPAEQPRSEPITEQLLETPTQSPTDSPNLPVEEVIAEPATASPVLTSAPSEPEVESIPSPIKESEPAPLPTPIEQVINTDSLPDISTESLPSLPEPLSESLPEPMSLPPVDCIPEPIALEAVSNSLTESEPIPNIPIESEKIQESIADIPLPNSEVILTNGDAHGPPSPVVDDTTLTTTTTHEGPVKQVIATSEMSEITEEKRHETNEADAPVPTAVEE